METKFKTRGKIVKDVGRKSLMFAPETSKNFESTCRYFKGAETARSLNSIGLKKSLSHFNVDFEPIFQPVQTSRNSLTDKNCKFEVLSRRLSLPSKLKPSPVILPSFSSKFLHNLSKLEHRLKLYYLNQNYL
jgi:hypothetical protein